MTRLGEIFAKLLDSKKFSSEEQGWEKLASRLDSFDAARHRKIFWRNFSFIAFAGFIFTIAAWIWIAPNQSGTDQPTAVEQTSAQASLQEPSDNEFVLTSQKTDKTSIDKAENDSVSASQEKDSQIAVSDQPSEPAKGTIRTPGDVPKTESPARTKSRMTGRGDLGQSKTITPDAHVPNTFNDHAIRDAAKHKVESDPQAGVSDANTRTGKPKAPVSTVEPERIENKESNSLGESNLAKNTETIAQPERMEPGTDKIVQSDVLVDLGDEQAEEAATIDQDRGSDKIDYMQSLIWAPETSNYAIVNDKRDSTISISGPSALETWVGISAGVFWNMKDIGGGDAAWRDRRNKQETTSITGAIGVSAEFKSRQWTFATGINYLTLGENTNYSSDVNRWVSGNSIVGWDIQNNSQWQTDTTNFYILVDSSYWSGTTQVVQYWNDSLGSYDSTFVTTPSYVVHNLDTQYFSVLDSTLVTQIDSLAILSADSTLETISDPNFTTGKQSTSYRYVEVPLWVGYDKAFGALTLGLRGGVGLGVLTTVDATLLKTNQSGFETITTRQTNRFVVNALLGFNVQYQLGPRWNLMAGPYLRRNLTSVMKGDFGPQHYTSAGGVVTLLYNIR